VISLGLEDALSRMAEAASEELLGGELVGLGSGATVARFVEALGSRVSRLKVPVRVIPSSSQIELVAERVGLELAVSSRIPFLDVAVDGADQIDGRFNMVKGGGGALLREEVLLGSAAKRLILADESKYVDVLRAPVPVEVVPFARTFVENRLVRLGGKPSLRLLAKGYPFVTENSNLIFDVGFGAIEDPPRLKDQLRIPGVVASGVFVGAGDVFYRACRDGRVERFEAKDRRSG